MSESDTYRTWHVRVATVAAARCRLASKVTSSSNMLPHTVAYNAQAAGAELQPLAELFGGQLAGGLYDFAARLGAPQSLKRLGVTEHDLDRATDLALKNPYWNSRPIERDAIRELLRGAWSGRRPD